MGGGCRRARPSCGPAVAAGCGGGDGGDETSQQTVAGTTQEAAAEQHAARVTKVQQLIPIARQSQAGKSRKEQIRISTAEFQLGEIAGKDLSAAIRLHNELFLRSYRRFFRAAYLEKLGSERMASLRPGSAPSGSVDYGRYE